MVPGTKLRALLVVPDRRLKGTLAFRSPASSTASSASKAASTPKIPSKRPPVGWVSLCEPLTTGATSPAVPGRRTNILPMSSIATPNPRSRAHVASRACASISFSPSAGRLTPPLAVAPSRAISTWRRHSRSPSMSAVGARAPAMGSRDMASPARPQAASSRARKGVTTTVKLPRYWVMETSSDASPFTPGLRAIGREAAAAPGSAPPRR